MSAIPSVILPVQQELFDFTFPIGTAGITSLGALLNGLLSLVLPVGTILDSMLTETQWNFNLGQPAKPLWIIADGRSIAGSTLAGLTGSNFAPNLCGIMRRGKNDGSINSNNNPDGDLALGTYTADKFLSHTHTYDHGGPFVTVALGFNLAPALVYSNDPTSATGANETAPKNITLNPFIRIN